MWFKYGLKAQKLLAQGAWSKLAYILSIEALSTVQVARFPISVFAVLFILNAKSANFSIAAGTCPRPKAKKMRAAEAGAACVPTYWLF